MDASRAGEVPRTRLIPEPGTLAMVLRFALLLALCSCVGAVIPGSSAKAERNRQLDELSALWSFYKFTYIRDGRVVSLDEGDITTSEGQSYAMLRAVWANDPWTFESVWRWTRHHLQVRGDKLFAWKWKDQVLDANSATDADVDVALALILASRRFSQPAYQEEALAVLDDIWKKDILHLGTRHFVSAGNWAPGETYPTLHVAYFAPYAYEVFAGVDARHPWQSLVTSSYDVLRWLYFDKGVRLPPELVFVDRRNGELLLAPPGGKESPSGYDSVPLLWRMAVDAQWFSRPEQELRRRMLAFFEEEYRARGRILDRYTTAGRPLSELEGLPHMATVQALARVELPPLAEALRHEKLDALWEKALAGTDTPYYLHNWLWFGRAFELDVVRHHDEFLGFLRPFDFTGFATHFPWVLFGVTVGLYPLARRSRWMKRVFLACAFTLALRYLHWRVTTTLNFFETLGPTISIALWLAEAYSFSTVALLVLQVGTRPKPPPVMRAMPEPLPTVDIFIPIYSEGLDILEKTLTAATAIRYPKKQLHVCDDSHRESVKQLAEEHGARYIRGPKKHAKAGNLNNAMTLTDGELLVVFDTDHLPVDSFLEETVPYFSDAKVGFIQTPHHFYNQDIFQRALRAGPAVPNEQDMFNHAIQGGRDSWGGSFFVGSGAVFRRKAMEGLGGFKLLSITEDIHTSQHLHAAGWTSHFVDRDLAVGLSAENLSGYLVQRQRWMQGCLQILFKDNPLFCRGLPLRHRVGYFASLYYFLFPLARVVFWATPLYFLLFHLHPLFADVSVLMAYVLPYVVVLPLINRALLPGWPRLFWGSLYEMAVSFTLVRGMLSMLLPKSLGFKVTPKGVTSDRRRFDVASSTLTLVAALVTLGAVVKGFFEFHYFGIEKDAYFFNLLWACANLVQLAVALLIAWESPQRRAEERLRRALPVEVTSDGFHLRVETLDVSLSGISLLLEAYRPIPREVEVRFTEGGPCLRARLVYNERAGRKVRCAFHFPSPSVEESRALVRLLFSPAEAWARAHETHTRSSLVLTWHFLTGIARSLRGDAHHRRGAPREATLQRWRCVHPKGARTLWMRDRSERGVGLLVFGAPLPVEGALPILGPGQPVRWARVVHQSRRFPGVYRVGLEFVPGLTEELRPHAYLAA
ncbi:MAG: glycosyl hydrolase family 8 [Myxococcaceae bacterium]|nr:glycosyl hydrolase family 8 [Myxococcaceae bacterium]